MMSLYSSTNGRVWTLHVMKAIDHEMDRSVYPTLNFPVRREGYCGKM